MAVREIKATGLEALGLATKLLQRARLADFSAGLWEAADVQWWWRRPRSSDHLEQVFWADRDGPVAAVLLTDWGQKWSCDPIVVPGTSGIALGAVWARAVEIIESLKAPLVEVLVRDDDEDLLALVQQAGLAPGEVGGLTWMGASDRPAPSSLPVGFRIVDRAERPGGPHPMRERNGEQVEERLQQCSLYDPTLDLAVLTKDDEIAGRALFWNDPVTGVGMLEPLRTEDRFRRLGVARALVTSGCDRAAARGATRLKVGFADEVARGLYTSVGFHITATDRVWAFRS